MSIRHTLKIEPNYLYRIQAKEKTSEIRLNDRDYQIGDLVDLCLKPTKPGQDLKSECTYQITHIHSGLGLQEGYVCLSFKIKENQ